MILVDSSVWIDHIRTPDPRLAGVLTRGVVITHPLIVGELACGRMARRAEFLDMLDRLPSALRMEDDEARTLIERHALMGRGLGFIDLHLLASALATGHVHLWTRDRSLASAALRLKVAFNERTLLH
jgi:predicted nucleic acid-binding protein